MSRTTVHLRRRRCRRGEHRPSEHGVLHVRRCRIGHGRVGAADRSVAAGAREVTTNGGSSVAEHLSDGQEGARSADSSPPRFDSRPPYQAGRWFGAKWGEHLGRPECPYVRRWVVVVGGYSVRLHHFYRSDDVRAPHDHPWWFVTLVLRGTYTDRSADADGVLTDDRLHVGSVRYRPALHRHSVVLTDGPCWTVIVTGKHSRRWGLLGA